MDIWKMIYMLLVLVLSSVAGSSPETCGQEQGTSIKFSLRIHRNQTNHRIVTVDLEKESPVSGDFTEKSLMDLDVFFQRTICNAKERVQVATVAAVEEKESKLRRSDYELFPGLGYYKWHTTAEAWMDASAKCMQENAHLIVINSDAEANVVKNLFNRNIAVLGTSDKTLIYIGVHDMDTEGQFVTVTGESLSSTGYTRWVSGQPDGGVVQNAVQVDKNALLRDNPASNKHGFICEQEL